MVEGNIKQRTISAMLWSTFGKFGTLGISFTSNIVLARLLIPEDFGCIGMLQIFIAISDILITGGFGAALVQKKNPTHIDYTSVFYWNLLSSLLMWILIYFCSPYVAEFYTMPLLCDILRIQSLSLIINSFAIVQSNQLVKQLKFKELSIRNVFASLVGTIVAITMAFLGYGVWSLVYSTLISSITSVFLLWNMSKWRPTLEFSIKSLKELFAFGGLMALSSFVDTIYTNIQGLIIGKWHSAVDMGYYSQAKRLEHVPTSSLSQIVSQVSFPVFSSFQDNKIALLNGVRKCVKSVTFINFPLSILMIVVARPLILLLYGERWESSIFYFQILCVGAMTYTINTMNNNVMKALGKSKVFFYVRLIERIIGISLIIIGANYGIEGLLYAVAINSYVNYFIISYTNERLLNYGILHQLKDVGTTLSIAIISGVITYCFGEILNVSYIVELIFQTIVYVVFYIIMSYYLKIEAFFLYKNIIIEKINISFTNRTKIN